MTDLGAAGPTCGTCGCPPSRSFVALGLAERHLLWRSEHGRGQRPAAHRLEGAARRLAWWERTYFPGQPRLFTRRLRALGLDRGRVLPLLAVDSYDDDRAGARPGAPLACPLAPLPCPLPPAVTDGDACPTLERAFQPMATWAWEQVGCTLDAVEATDPTLVVDRSSIEEQLRAFHGQRCLTIALRALIVDLHVERSAGRLRGATSEERYQDWVRAVTGDDGLARLLAAFPVLAPLLARATEGVAASWSEMLQRLGKDWVALRRTFGRPDDPDRLVQVEAGLGDSHDRGRTVMRLRFESGFAILYKPRPMSADVHFQDLLAWFTDQGLDPPLRTLRVLDSGEHGWVEEVVPQACRTHAEVEAFYRRQGILLFALYLLDAKDMHWENLVAAGEHPVLVDLESLFQPRPATAPGTTPSAVAVREAAFHELVLSTLLLPLGNPGAQDGEGPLDVGGLSDLGGQRSARPVAEVTGVHSDGMRIVRRVVELDSAANVPRLDGQTAKASDHVKDLIGGFTDAYRLAVAERTALAAEGGPLRRFLGDRVRHVLRDTSDYAVLLDGSYHPSCLGDAIERDFVFDALWLATSDQPHLEALVASERDDLWVGDIPSFTSTVGSPDLTDSRGRTLPGFFATSGMARVLSRLTSMDEVDLARQVHCIRSTLPGGCPAPPREAARGRGREATRPELVGAATAIGEKLTQLAVHRDGEAHWAGVVPLAGGGSLCSIVGPDLYQGTAGIALFLAYLAQVTSRDDFDELARAAYAGVARELLSPQQAQAIGAYTGTAGLLYTALHVAHLWRAPDVVAAARPTLDGLARRVRHDESFDVMGGAAGCLLVMLRLAEHLPDSPALAIARRCGRHLVRHAVHLDGGLGWQAPSGDGPPLLGISHGSAGIALALARLAAATGDSRLDRAARGAIAYERAHYHPGLGNWPDLRSGADPAITEGRQFLWAWCHGAPGIGIARVAMRLEGDHAGRDDEVDDEVAAALRSTEQRGFGGSHCLCHGDLGNAELFTLAAQAHDEPRWGRVARRWAHAVLEDHRQLGVWRCNGIDLVQSPALMSGIAGIGYGLLRLAEPDAVPSVLVLEGP